MTVGRLVLLPGVLLLLLLLLPVVGLVGHTSPTSVLSAWQSPQALAALGLSLRTSAGALVVVVLCGTPLAWWLSRARSTLARVCLVLVETPVVLPPSVLGLALLETFGRKGLFGPWLDLLGVHLPFTTAAVVLAQVVVAAPLFVLTATAALRAVDDDTLLVARTLGKSPLRAGLEVAVPMALPGLVSGAALGWARALGEFGATLLFAGSLPGRTQTLPLAIYGALEHDLALAHALAVLLVAVTVSLVLGMRLWGGTRGP